MRQHQIRTGPIVNDQAPFSVEMSQGWQPSQPRLTAGPRLKEGVSLAQTTHVQAPMSVEMFQGWQPAQPREFVHHQVGWMDAQTTHVQAPISIEMFQGWQPVQPREFIRPRVGWSDTQTTHVQAPISIEMIEGWQPNQPVSTDRRTSLGWISIEPVPPAVVVAFSIEMVQGWQPSQPLAHVRRTGWVDAQTTPIEAPISIEMLQGWHPNQPVPTDRSLRLGWVSLDPVPPVVVVFSMEMAQGWHPDRFVSPEVPGRWGVPLWPDVVLASAFSMEMAQGSAPLRGPGLTMPTGGLLFVAEPQGLMVQPPLLTDYSSRNDMNTMWRNYLRDLYGVTNLDLAPLLARYLQDLSNIASDTSNIFKKLTRRARGDSS